MKREWIYNFDKILQNHKDLSDYERYYISYKKYILEHEKEHKKIFKVLYKAIKKFNKTFLLSIAYRLISYLKVDLKINKSILKKHFRLRNLKRYLFPIMKRSNFTIKESKIKKMLYDENYEDRYFFSFLIDYKDILIPFLLLEDTKYTRKQLLIILHTCFYYNIKYYIKFLGDKNRHHGFIMYEILTQMIKENIQIDSIEIINNENTYIELKEKIQVDSIDNFLINFLCFMKNKTTIYQMIQENKIKEIENILTTFYVDTEDSLKNIRHLNLYSTEIKQTKNNLQEFIFKDIDEDYAFLFSGTNYKSVSDCIEF